MITIYQGDDSNAMGEQIILRIQADIDLTGFSAIFQIGDFQQKFSDIASGELPIVIPSEATQSLPVGNIFGAVKVFDASGLAKTIKADIPFRIIRRVVENDK
jgi:hypothetical protein